MKVKFMIFSLDDLKMIHNHSQNTRFRSITDWFYFIFVEENKIVFNLSLNLEYVFSVEVYIISI